MRSSGDFQEQGTYLANDLANSGAEVIGNVLVVLLSHLRWCENLDILADELMPG